jgi:hypothetical protein
MVYFISFVCTKCEWRALTGLKLESGLLLLRHSAGLQEEPNGQNSLLNDNDNGGAKYSEIRER